MISDCFTNLMDYFCDVKLQSNRPPIFWWSRSYPTLVQLVFIEQRILPLFWKSMTVAVHFIQMNFQLMELQEALLFLPFL